MRAIILAGGTGTRLQPYTVVLPKPLMPIGDLAILEVVLLQLAARGFTHVTMAVGYLAHLIRAVVGDGQRYGLRIDYSVETTPLGTAGPIALAPDLGATFLVMNGDILTDLDYAALAAHHLEARAACTVAVFQKDVRIDLGVLEIAHDAVVGYIEKPTLSYSVSSGIYMFDQRALQYIPRGERFDLPDLVLRLIANQERVLAHQFKGSWLDLGTPDDYARATDTFLAHRDRFIPDGRKPLER